MCLFKIHFQKNVNVYSLNVDVVNLKWKFIYLGRRPSPSPLLSPDVLADVDVVDLKLSIIHELRQKLIFTPDDAENMHAKFDAIQLSIFRDTKNNVSCAPNGRWYSDDVKEFATTLNYYSPKAYQYVR